MKKEILNWLVTIIIVLIIVLPMFTATHYRNEALQVKIRNEKLKDLLVIEVYKNMSHVLLLKNINELDSTIIYKAGGSDGILLLEADK